ncbi:hypothetical protein BH23PLA1_BH23PLA1_42700 [soil metagenome]
MSRARRGIPSWLVNVLLSALAFALLGLAVWMNQEELRKVFERQIDRRLFALAFVVYLSGLVLTFFRWYLLVRALGLPFRVRDALRLGFIGNVYNLVIPGAVGGDVVKGAFLCREQERKTQAVASMVVDRLVGLVGLFLLAGCSGLLAWSGANAEVRSLIALAWGASACGLIGLAVLFTPTLYRPLIVLLARKPRLAAIVEELVTMASAYRARLGVVAIALLMAMGNHSLNVLAFYGVDLALFGERVPTLGQHFLIVPLTLFTTAVPLPFGALGVSEHAGRFLFDQVQHPSGAVAMMGFRVLMYAGGVVSVIVYLFNIRQVRDLSREGEGSGRVELSTNPESDPDLEHAQAPGGP